MEGVYFLFNTEETESFLFPIFCMYIVAIELTQLPEIVI